MRAYRTVQGDTWDVIALKMYPNLGGEKLMHILLQENSEHQETVIFGANVMLRIPKVDTPVVSTLGQRYNSVQQVKGVYKRGRIPYECL